MKIFDPSQMKTSGVCADDLSVDLKGVHLPCGAVTIGELPHFDNSGISILLVTPFPRALQLVDKVIETKVGMNDAEASLFSVVRGDSKLCFNINLFPREVGYAFTEGRLAPLNDIFADTWEKGDRIVSDGKVAIFILSANDNNLSFDTIDLIKPYLFDAGLLFDYEEHKCITGVTAEDLRLSEVVVRDNPAKIILA